MQATLKQNSTAKVNLPEREHGQSRDLAGRALGVSGKTVGTSPKLDPLHLTTIIAGGGGGKEKKVDQGLTKMAGKGKRV